MENWLRRYWGSPLLALLVLSWMAFVGSRIPRPTAIAFTMVLSAADAYYFAFSVPMWCNAVNRNGTLCRENSTGVLWGCHRRQHKWQRLKMVVVRARWRQLYKELFSTAPQGFATISGSMATLSTVIASTTAVVALFLKLH